MSSFPAITPLNSTIVNKIQDTPKEIFSGNSAFISLTNFYDSPNKSLNYSTYTSFKLENTKQYKNRFPPIITGLSTGHAGNLGTIRRAKIQIKFSSMNDLEAHQSFFKIGNSQLVAWGWSKGNSQNLPSAFNTAKNIILNIEEWHNLIEKYKHEVDFLAGILTNFSIKMGSDASVDVELEISSPSEIPAYLSLNKNKKESTLDSDSSSDSLVKICKALDLDGNVNGLSEETIKENTVNYTGWAKTAVKFVAGRNTQEYIRLGFAIEQICNYQYKANPQVAGLETRIDLGNSVCMAHPNIISVSENVLFPNPNCMGFEDGMNQGTRVIKPTNAKTQPFGPFNSKYLFPEENVDVTVFSNGAPAKQTIKDGYAGKIENIFISTEFLTTAAKGSSTVNDFLQKIVDEVNIAGAGLYNLILRPDFYSKNGKNVFSIVDLNFSSDNKIVLPTINLFPTNTYSRITELDLNVDMPKEIIGEIMLGENSNSMQNIGIKIFQGYKIDTVLINANIKQDGPTNIQTNNAPTTNNDSVWEQAGKFLGALWDVIATKLNTSGPYREKFSGTSPMYGTEDPIFGVYKDVSAVKTFYSKDTSGKILRNALVPVTISLTVSGIAGVTIGTATQFNPSPVPWMTNGFWQITNVEHKVEDSNWTTTIEFKFRVKN